MSSNNSTTNSESDTPLLLRPYVMDMFLNQQVIVGVIQNNKNNTNNVVGLQGRLDSVDPLCNVVLSSATSPGLLGGSTEVQKIAAARGANVAFFGIPVTK